MSVMSANPELQKKLRNFIEECGSQTKAARALGKSAATLSTYLNDRYNGNLSDFEKFLTETFETKAAAENLKSAQVLNSYKPTSISSEVYETIRLCHLKGGLAIECGDAGIGKTMACKKYAENLCVRKPLFSNFKCIFKTALQNTENHRNRSQR